MGPAGHFIPPLFVFPRKNIKTRTDEWHTVRMNPHLPPFIQDTERDFFPGVSSFHQTYKDDKIRYCYHITVSELFTHK
jgi:hypothetical protein